MDYERAIIRLEGMQDDIQKKIDGLPPLMRGRTSLWADLEALSIAKGAIYNVMAQEKERKKAEAIKWT